MRVGLRRRSAGSRVLRLRRERRGSATQPVRCQQNNIESKRQCASKNFWDRDVPDQRLRLRWFYKRPGRRELELCVHGGTPTSAREDVRLLCAGDEATIMCVYLQNDGGGECHYHNDFDLLQELTVDQLKQRIAVKNQMLKLCVRYPRASSRD